MTAVMEQPTTQAGTKLTLPLVALRHAMSIVAPAVARKTTIPILSNVRIDKTESFVEFTATDLDLTIRVRVATQDDSTLKPMLLPALKLEAFSKLLQGDSISFKLTGEHASRAEMRCGRSVTKVPNSSVNGFPNLQFGGEQMGVQLTQSEAKRLISFTQFAVTDLGDKYTLNGALLDIHDGKLRMVSTDGHRLAVYTIPTEETKSSTLLPGAFIAALGKSIDEDDPAPLFIDSNEASVFANFGDKTGQIALSHRKLSGQFPNYQAVMPRAQVLTLTVDADAIGQSLKRCLMFADDRSNAVRLTVGTQEIKLNGASAEAGETDETVDVISASCAGEVEPFTIGFSGKYLMDAFSRLTGEVQMRFAALNAQNAMTIYAEPAAGETFECVVMPMRV